MNHTIQMLRYLATILLLFFVTLQKARSQAPACKDSHVWCKGLRSELNFCENAVMKTLCKKTCNLCNIADCENCEQLCDEATGTCLCRDGYRLKADKRTCEDINECREMGTPCNSTHPECSNYAGGYACLRTRDSCLNQKFHTNYYGEETCCKQSTQIGGFGKCGLNSHNTGRIVGGRNTIVEMWPWMTHLRIGVQLCGGSLINERWVVTAAHCFSGFTDDVSTIEVTVGLRNTSRFREEFRQSKTVKQYVVHELFDYPNYDIALVQLDTPVKWSTYVGPVCLPNGEVPKPGTKCFATGYGTTAFFGQATQVLQEVDLPIVNPEVCQKAFADQKTQVNPKTMICAGYVTGGKDACQGDSGGPLVCQRCDSCDFYLAGITSFGKGCGLPGYYGVYVHVEVMEDWIASKISSISVKKKPCIKTAWSKWQSWSNCTAVCGGGTRFRMRYCLNGIAGQSGCFGSFRETESCNSSPCSGAKWGEFMTNSDCTATCGGGKILKTRKCIGGKIGEGKCVGGDQITEECNIQECPRWSAWVIGRCDKVCGEGKQTNTRSCLNGKAGDKGCEGPSSETVKCNAGVCKGDKSESAGSSDSDDKESSKNILLGDVWSPWSECSASCGIGKQVRACLNCDKTEEQVCNVKRCPRWSSWQGWSECNKPCGEGTRTAQRDCLFGQVGEAGCIGSNSKTEKCNEQLCPWGDWGEYSTCSKQCGGGLKKSTRLCLNGESGSLNGCEGEAVRQLPCNTHKCEVSFTQWTGWGLCSQSCGTGEQVRIRSCPVKDCVPDENGSDVKMVRSCNEQLCLETFSPWSDWTECTISCGGGLKYRSRTCPSSGGCIKDGFGSVLFHETPCNVQPCPIWGEWGEYGNCSKECGGGIKSKTRKCIGGNVGDKGCEGVDSQHEKCNIHSCARWGEWTEWGVCSVTCGEGIQVQSRVCIGASAGDEGCLGETENVRTCSMPVCVEECSFECQNLVSQFYCFNPTIMNAWFNCADSCCECKDDPDTNCEDLGLFSWNCNEYKCKAYCNLCTGL